MPTTQYQQLLAQLDDVSQKLRAATGSAFLIGSGGDGGFIQTATAQAIQKAETIHQSAAVDLAHDPLIFAQDPFRTEGRRSRSVQEPSEN
ncbi:hypothetical protein [Mesorhizobium temperatum]|uniref:hypothetical protein n=1 Tax=Mesorhizobium temperatum TaxID=241416 RepID=UPI001FDA7700|nr:hypothetical protein [Mesorhizobium temperatum]